MRKLGIMLLIMCMVLSFSAISVFADDPEEPEEPTSGTCGDNLTWVITQEDGQSVLTISGTGPMYDYEFTFVPSSDYTPYSGDVDKVIIEDGVTTIGEYAFCSFHNLASVSIPNSVNRIGKSAFYNNTSLERVVIPKGVSAIEEKTFSECTNLKEIDIPDSVTSIGEESFGFCKSLKNVSIPSSVNMIGPHAFNGDSSLESIIIPDAVTAIEEWTFSGCTNLKEIVIPDSVTSIGDWAFSYCSSLKSIDIPDSVTSIGHWAFSDCTGLERVTLPNGLTWLPNAFENCTSLRSVVVPSSVKQMGETFRGCTNLTDVTLPDGLESFAGSTFEGCSSLESIDLPKGLESFGIGEATFTDCTSLKSIEIPYRVNEIGESAFENCTSLETVSAPGVYEIFGKAFNNCSSLRDIDVADVTGSGWTEIGGVKINVYNNSFENCTSLESFTIAGGMDNIGSYAFHNCTALKKIYIPDTVTLVGTGAFRDCTGLTDVYFSGTESQWKAIEIKSYNEPLVNAKVHYNTKFVPDKVIRIYGQNRYDTAFAAADAFKAKLGVDKFDAVVVAYGQNYADALSASALADVMQAPVLLVMQNQENRVSDYIKANLKPGGKVYLIGGTGVIRSEFESSLKAQNYSVKRLAGSDRFGTNEAILNEYFANASDYEVLVCCGVGANGYADALSVSSLGKPILLVGYSLTDSQRAYLKKLSDSKGEVLRFTVIGGTGAVSASLESEVAAYQETGRPIRIAGSNRYGTSAEIAKHYFTGGSERVVLVYGNNYPDGLSASSLAYEYKAPVLLAVDNYNVMEPVRIAVNNTLYNRLCIVLGGPTYVTDNVCNYCTRY